MNFKFLWLTVLLLSACGVKGPPRPPQDATVPSIEEDHPDLQLKPGTIYPNKAP